MSQAQIVAQVRAEVEAAYGALAAAGRALEHAMAALAELDKEPVRVEEDGEGTSPLREQILTMGGNVSPYPD